MQVYPSTSEWESRRNKDGGKEREKSFFLKSGSVKSSLREEFSSATAAVLQ